jgi:hypothetical protein
MNLTNKTSTITVAVTGALVALALAAHASGTFTFSPAHAAGQRAVRGTVTAGQRGGSGGGPAGSNPSPGVSAAGQAGGTGASGGTGSGQSGGTSSGGGSSSGSGSSSGGHHLIPHLLLPGFPHTPPTIVTAIPSPSGTIGDPGVPCLQGYVWRQAYAGDYVCVSPGNRAQAAADNAAALSRVAAGGGAYGQYTCQQGYVWRQVVPDDYTCVTPGVRASRPRSPTRRPCRRSGRTCG